MRRFSIALITLMLAGCGSDSDDPNSSPDARTQALSYARDDLPCTTEADCCVVFDGCRATGLIVAAADKDKVSSLLASASNDSCLLCIAPAVQVKCEAGKCTGVEVEPGSGADMDAGESFRKNHCGTMSLPAGWSEKTQSVPSSPPGWSPSKVIGC
jgi:hypothetical protein